MDDKPIKSISSFDVEINDDSKYVVAPSGTTSSKQSKWALLAQPISSIQSTPVSASGLANWSTAKTSSIEIKTMIGANRIGSIIKVKNNLWLLVILFFWKNLGSSSYFILP